MQFELSVERAARQHEQAVVAEKDAFITELQALIERLEGQVQDYRRYLRSGQSPRSWTRRNWNWRWKIRRPTSPRRRHRSRSLRIGWQPASRTPRSARGGCPARQLHRHLQDEQGQALWLHGRSLHPAHQRPPPGPRHRRPDALGLHPDGSAPDRLNSGEMTSPGPPR